MSKFKKFVIAFAAVYFIAIAGLTYFSSKVDSLIYPVVSCAVPSTGSLDPRESSYFGQTSTVVPTASIKDGFLWYVQKNSSGEYHVYKTEVKVVEQTAIYSRLEDGFKFISLVVCETDKELHEGDRVLVKAGVL